MKRNTFDLIIEFVKTSFKMRYQNSVLGFLWVLIKPYTMFLVMFVIFSHIVRSSVSNYSVYLLTGVIFITFINELLLLGQSALLDRASIILKVNFDRQIAIVSALIGSIINLVINLVLIYIIAFFTHVPITFVGFLMLILVISILFIWGWAIALFTSILTVRFRDLKNIMELLMFILQYTTPIFYSLDDDFLPDKVADLIRLNPLTFLMNQMRASIGVYGSINLFLLLIFFLAGIFTLFLGWQYFSVNVKKTAEYI
ncbi:ABC transporter permease [Candidatus Dojkabacteria bacterium]|uniref:Transport permease protein n=1 Tax=Candidatus Dojkabacteria bacterium TaxID=2099670 RepID=A0A955I908_9BACT|nr:ABC transporter permease [Candidatus Dojkabacteria bacterium]